MTNSDFPIPRHLLAKHFGNDQRMIAAMEEQSRAVEEASVQVAETQALKDATVIVLSANGDFTNERVLEISDDIDLEITETTIRLKLKNVARAQDFGVTFIAPAEVELFLPAEGTLMTQEMPIMNNLGNYANDAAAAAGGVPIHGIYHNAGALRVRLA